MYASSRASARWRFFFAHSMSFLQSEPLASESRTIWNIARLTSAGTF
jgi:hypothetical protein